MLNHVDVKSAVFSQMSWRLVSVLKEPHHLTALTYTVCNEVADKRFAAGSCKRDLHPEKHSADMV